MGSVLDCACNLPQVSLMVPWIAEADQKVLFKDNVSFKSPEDQVQFRISASTACRMLRRILKYPPADRGRHAGRNAARLEPLMQQGKPDLRSEPLPVRMQLKHMFIWSRTVGFEARSCIQQRYFLSVMRCNSDS